MLERNPEAMNPEPLPGHVWLETPGRVLHVEERVLEFTDGSPCELRSGTVSLTRGMACET